MIGLVLALTLASPVPSPAPRDLLAPIAATIAVSRSTNTPGYRVSVRHNGLLDLARDGAATTHLQVDPKSLSGFFAALQAAGPLDALPAGQCMKSASFGTTTRVSSAGAVSPDLQCAQGDVHEAALAAAVDGVIAMAGGALEQGHRGLLPVRRSMPGMVPVPAESGSPTPAASPRESVAP